MTSIRSFPRLEPALQADLDRLLAMPYPTFAVTVARLMKALGYTEVRLMGAKHARGRNSHGGLDIEACTAGGLSPVRAIAQAKQYAGPVPRCFVDELRGTMARLGAQQGLIVTTSSFSPSAVEAALAGQYALPVRLVGGAELVRLLRKHGIPLAAGEGTPPATGTQKPPREAGPDGSRAGSPPLAPAARCVQGRDGNGLRVTLIVGPLPSNPGCLPSREAGRK